MFDNQSMLKAVNRWMVEGEKGAPGADILVADIEKLRKRLVAGTAMKAHAAYLYRLI